MSDTKEKVLAAAMQLERDGKKFYDDLAEKSSSDLATRIFKSLAEDEVQHLRWLESFVVGDVDVPAANRNIYSRLKNIFAEVPEDVRKSFESAENDIAGLKLGVDMESRSEQAYAKWAEDCEDPEAKELCRLIAAAEVFHRELIENAIQYLDHTIDWFMQEEHWSFDGG